MTSSAKTILIVEDNELNMRLFNDILQASGYQTLQTGDGSEAVILAEEHHPDLILMDIQMPEMDGLEATRAIRAWETSQGRAPTPILALTGTICLCKFRDGQMGIPI